MNLWWFDENFTMEEKFYVRMYDDLMGILPWRQNSMWESMMIWWEFYDGGKSAKFYVIKDFHWSHFPQFWNPRVSLSNIQYQPWIYALDNEYVMPHSKMTLLWWPCLSTMEKYSLLHDKCGTFYQFSGDMAYGTPNVTLDMVTKTLVIHVCFENHGYSVIWTSPYKALFLSLSCIVIYYIFLENDDHSP